MENIYKKFYQFGLNNEHNFGIFIDSANKYGKNNQMQEYKPNNLRRSPNNGGDVSYMKNQMNTLKSENFDRNMTMKNKEETNNKIPNKFYFSEFDNTHLPKVSSISQPNNNSTIRSQPEVDLKLQQLQLKMQNMEKQHNDDKQILLDIINHNILNIKPYENPNILNNLKSSAQQNNGFGKSNNQKFMETNQDYYVNEDGEVDNKKTIKGLNVDETKVALKRLKDLKEDLGKRIDDEELRGYNQRSELEADMKVIHSELMSKFERLENTRKMNMERIAYILEHSGSSRVKNMSKRLFGGCKLNNFIYI